MSKENATFVVYETSYDISPVYLDYQYSARPS